MKAVCVHQFGGLDVLTYEEIPRPTPGTGQLLVRVRAAGVGPWDALIRAGASALPQPLPLVPGSDIAGDIEAVGAGVSSYRRGDAVFGVTNDWFTGGYAEYAVAEAAMIAPKPERLGYVEAAALPVVASTARQMVFDHGGVTAGKRVLVHGAAGNVGAFAVQFAKGAGAEVIATGRSRDVEYIRSLGADEVIDTKTTAFEERTAEVDVVLDTIGGEVLERSFEVLKRGGVLVSAVTKPDQEKAARHGVRAEFFLVAVTSEGLQRIAGMVEAGQLKVRVGEVLPLAQARLAHEMLAGKSHKPGKIVLSVGA
jgi:NADPH:quinone reductase-like Zn-dependent oxidoreductase